MCRVTLLHEPDGAAAGKEAGKEAGGASAGSAG